MKNTTHFESIVTTDLEKATGGCHKGGAQAQAVAQAACPGCSSSSSTSSSFVFMQAPQAAPPPPPQQQVAARHSSTAVDVSYG